MRLVRAAIAARTTSGAVGAVMLADAEGVQPDLVGEHGLLDHLAQHPGVRLQAGHGIERDIAEGVDAEGERKSHTRTLARSAGRAYPGHHRTS
jgi:hypothetical protein